MLTLTREDCIRLRKLWKEAEANGQTELVFDGHNMLTDYAGYLVEYLAMNGMYKKK